MNEQSQSWDNPDARSEHRSFYAGLVADFLRTEPTKILGQLSSRHVELHSAVQAEQMQAWRAEIELLRMAFVALGDSAANWSVLLEAPLFRLGKRLDAVVLWRRASSP
jgi:hypothetical protein